MLPRKANHLVVYDSVFAELAAAATAFLKGHSGFFSWFRRIRVVRHFLIPLADLLREVKPPRMILLIAHGMQGRVRAANAFLPNHWWENLPEEAFVYGYGCQSAHYFDTYRLRGRIRGFLGHQSDFDMLFQGNGLDPLFQRLLRGIGQQFWESSGIDQQFHDRIAQIYERALSNVKRHFREDRGDLLRLYCLESQAASLVLRV